MTYAMIGRRFARFGLAGLIATRVHIAIVSALWRRSRGRSEHLPTAKEEQ